MVCEKIDTPDSVSDPTCMCGKNRASNVCATKIKDN